MSMYWDNIIGAEQEAKKVRFSAEMERKKQMDVAIAKSIELRNKISSNSIQTYMLVGRNLWTYEDGIGRYTVCRFKCDVDIREASKLFSKDRRYEIVNETEFVVYWSECLMSNRSERKFQFGVFRKKQKRSLRKFLNRKISRLEFIDDMARTEKPYIGYW